MNASTSGRPCIRHRVSWALQNRFCSCSIHNEQNGSPQTFRLVGSAAGMLAAHASGPWVSRCPLAV